MINLSNLKAGQTKQLDGNVTVTKEDGHYKVVTDQGTALLRFVKDSKSWHFVVEGRRDEHELPEGTTGKTAVETLIANWPAAPEPVEEPAAPAAAPKVTAAEKAARKREDAKRKVAALIHQAKTTQYAEEAETLLAQVAVLMDKYALEDEDVRRAQGGEAGEGDDEIVQWSYDIDTQGGHAPHRCSAYEAVAAAMGAGTYHTTYKPSKTAGYRDYVIKVHVIAQADVIENLKIFFPIMELQMERLAAQVSKQASSAARAVGAHHSLHGAHARRGFIRGFGRGVADRIGAGRQETVAEDESGSKALVVRDRQTAVTAWMDANVGEVKHVKAQKYSGAAYQEGRERGYSFASPAVPEGAAQEAINA